MLTLQVANSPDHYVKLGLQPVTIGSDKSNSLILDVPQVSDFHAEILSDDAGLYIVDLLSGAGTYVNEHRVLGQHRLHAWDVIRVGNIHLEIRDPNTSKPGTWVLRTVSDLLSNQFHSLGAKTVVGRDPDCDLTIDWHLLSRRHAEIYVMQDHLKIVDLDSSNGTWINGKRVKEGTAFSGDELRFDEKCFVVVGPSNIQSTVIPEEDKTQVRESPVSQIMLDNTLQTGSGNASLVCLGKRGKQRIPVLKNEFSLGRSAENDLVIDDLNVSKKHALILFSRNQWILKDTNSRNGVSLNGKQITEAILNHGDQIALGGSDFVFEQILPLPEEDDTLFF